MEGVGSWSELWHAILEKECHMTWIDQWVLLYPEWAVLEKLVFCGQNLCLALLEAETATLLPLCKHVRLVRGATWVRNGLHLALWLHSPGAAPEKRVVKRTRPQTVTNFNVNELQDFCCASGLILHRNLSNTVLTYIKFICTYLLIILTQVLHVNDLKIGRILFKIGQI